MVPVLPGAIDGRGAVPAKRSFAIRVYLQSTLIICNWGQCAVDGRGALQSDHLQSVPATEADAAGAVRSITETNRMHLVLFGMQRRPSGPYLAAIHRILV
jgi:hypothetical protein